MAKRFIPAILNQCRQKRRQSSLNNSSPNANGAGRASYELDGYWKATFDLINIHLFHDASNLAACEQFPSVYCKSRRRALLHTLERFHKDPKNELVPFFIFGDFNFRCDTEGVVKVRFRFSRSSKIIELPFFFLTQK